MKRFLTIFTLAFALLPLRAQVATVEVSRPYDVNLDGIRKPAIPTAVDDSLQRFDVHFDYSIFNRPYGDLYDFTPYESIQLATVGANRTPYVFLRAGAQYAPGEQGILPAGELYVQSKPKNGFCSGLYARHNSFFGDLGRKVPDYNTLRTNRMQNAVGGDLTYDWSTGELMLDVQYDYDRYAHRLTEIIPAPGSVSSLPQDDSHAIQSIKGSVNLNSAQKEANTVYYDVTFAYRDTRKNYSLTNPTVTFDEGELGEGLLTVRGYVGASFDIHRIYVDMNIEHVAYRGMRDFRAGVVEFSPFYQYNRRRLQARLGVKFGSRYGQVGELPIGDLNLSPRSTIFPDFDIRYALIEKSLWAHAVVTGGNDLNTFSRMVDDCPIVHPASRMDFGRRPLDATVSLEGVFSGRLGVNLEGIFKITRNKMMFVPVYDGTHLPLMSTLYRDVNQYSFQGEVFWKSQDFTVGGRLRYAGYYDPDDKTDVTEMPNWTGNAYFRYNFRERIIAQIECTYRSETYGHMLVEPEKGTYVQDAGLLYEVPRILDIDLNVNYLINNHFSVFAKVGNLLNQRNQYMPLYLEPGINFGGGLCINF